VQKTLRENKPRTPSGNCGYNHHRKEAKEEPNAYGPKFLPKEKGGKRKAQRKLRDEKFTVPRDVAAKGRQPAVRRKRSNTITGEDEGKKERKREQKER